MDELIQKLKDIVKNSNRIVAFTGAEISSESGIPTYRGTGGLWSKYDPAIYANIDFFYGILHIIGISLEMKDRIWDIIY